MNEHTIPDAATGQDGAARPRPVADAVALRWIGDDLNEVLRLAQRELEAFAEGDREPVHLTACRGQLHEVRATLQLLELHGGAMLADEMEQTAAALAEGEVVERKAAAEALMLGLVQLPDYLGRLAGGEADVPLMLLPVLNDLREARRARAVSEISMFAPQLETVIAAEPVESGGGNPALGEELRLRRGPFLRALLGWYKNPQAADNLETIRDLIEQVLEQAATARMRRLLEAADAVVTEIIERGAEPDTTERLLFGRIDRFFKVVIDLGEARAVEDFPTDLLRHLLYYAARSESEHPVVSKVRQLAVEANRVARPVPGADGSAGSSAGNALFEAVGEALRQDLRGMKDDLDLFMRGNRADLSRLTRLAEPLRRVGDTLGVIGSGALRAKLVARSEQIKAVEGAGAAPEDDVLMGIAGDLLRVESALSGLGDTEAMEQAASDQEIGLSSEELQQHLAAAYAETFLEIARVKEAFSQYLDNPADRQPLEPLDAQLQQLGGVLRVLDQAGAGELLAGLRPFVRQLLDGSRGVPDEAERDALADVVTGVEFFLEAAIKDRSDRRDILAYAAGAAARLLPPGEVAEAAPERDEAAVEAEQVAAPADAVPAEAPEPQIEPLGSEPEPELEPEPEAELEAEPQFEPELAEALEPPSEEGLAGAAEALLPGIDPEILEVFLEEAREELGAIQEQYPRWRSRPDDGEALRNFRRSFHTLKGSGRMVGATALGEFAWAAENLLNGVIEGTVPVDDTLIGLLDEVCGLLPALVEAQAGGTPPAQATLDALSERAFALAEGRAAAPAAAPAAPVAEVVGETVAEVVEAVAAAAIDLEDVAPEEVAAETATPLPADAEPPIALEPELFEVFRTESASHLGILDARLAHWEQGIDGPGFDEALERAMHTLHGSAQMAGVEPVAALAGALEGYVAAQRRLGAGLDAAAGDLLTRARAALAAVVGAVNRPGAELPDWPALAAEIAAAQAAVEAQPAPAPPSEPTVELAEVLEAFEPPEFETAPAEAYDPELLEIFLEEARELIERMDSEFQAWREAPGNLEPVADLQRTLHTLKGGARLAGILDLGDLSHAMESMFEAIVNRLLEVSPELQTEARRGIDQLANAVEHLHAEGRMVPTERALARIEAAVRGEFLEPDSTLVEPAASGPAPVESGPEAEPEPAEPAAEEAPAAPAAVAHPGDSPASEAAEPPGETVAAAAQAEPPPAAPPGEAPRTERRRALPGAGMGPGRRAGDLIRVRADLLDQLVNNAGEVAIYRSRLAQQNTTLEYDLEELEGTVTRLREQLRKLELETETQILSRYETEQNVDFDPLELDRYSTMQELSRALSETVSDLASIGQTLHELSRDTETLLLQHTRVSNELQDGLLRTRMVPFGTRSAHLQRVVRQTGETLGKRAELHIEGDQGEIDRNILERVMGPLEHLLRNAVAHGVESPQARAAAGKPAEGRVDLKVAREGSDVVIAVSDDGAGLDRAAIRRKAIERGLLDPAAEVSDADLDAMILAPGFSTSAEITQVSGRGVGTDVVLNEVKQLGGSLSVASEPGRGATFTIRLPFTLSISEGLLVQQGEDVFAVPHGTVDGVTRVARADLEACYSGQRDGIEYADTQYRVRYLGSMLGAAAPVLPEGVKWFPVLLVRTGDHRIAVQVDALLGNRQVVVKSLGAQLANIRWFTGATILADGNVALILDINSLVRIDAAQQAAPAPTGAVAEATRAVTVMVVDDSITVRKVTGRLLERHNMQVVTAKDGVDAVARLQELRPDVMLLDIEMPRMDGFELARHMQNTPELSDVPIVMITSRTGDKHRDRALELGVRRYLGKPYQEAELLENIYSVLGERPA